MDNTQTKSEHTTTPELRGYIRQTVATVKLGSSYKMRWHDWSMVTVRVVSTTLANAFGYNSRRQRHYNCVNLNTGRPCVVKSASKLREEVFG